MGKGVFAQKMALQLAKSKVGFTVPKYIEDAVKWVIKQDHEKN